MANIYIGSDGMPIEQSEDGAFYVTQEKADTSQQFKEIMNEAVQPDEKDSGEDQG